MYQELLSGHFSDRPQRANIQYLLTPVALPAGLFHSKVLLFTTPTDGWLFVGSANLTQQGLTANAEMVAQFRFQIGEKEEHGSLFADVVTFLETVTERYGTRNTRSNLAQLMSETPWLTGRRELPTSGEFMHNLSMPLLDQLVARAAAKVRSVSVVSRYFDREPSVLEMVVEKLSPPVLRIYTQNRFTTLSSAWLKHSLTKSGKVKVYASDFQDDGALQPLHAKAMSIELENETLFFYGSPNFSTRGWLSTAADGNLETGILVRAGGKQFRDAARALCDPHGNAIELVDASDLISSPPEHVTRREAAAMRLDEIELDGNKIMAFVDGVPKGAAAAAEIESDSLVKERVTLAAQLDRYAGVIPEGLADRFSSRSVIASVVALAEDGTELARSNRLFLTSLIDAETGQGVRARRQLKRAQESAAQFLAVLADLIKGNDEELLQSFFLFCDIPISLGPRPRFGVRHSSAIHDSMRHLGTRNFTLCLNLHQAAVGFVERHLRRLRRLINERDPLSIPNFLHIFLAIGCVLRVQTERAIQGLEAKEAYLTASEWEEFRRVTDQYLNLFKETSERLCKEFVPPFVKTRGRSRSRVDEYFAADLPPVLATYSEIMGYRDRVEALRQAKARRSAMAEPFAYFYSRFGEREWNRYKSELVAATEHIQSTFAVPPVDAGAKQHSAGL